TADWTDEARKLFEKGSAPKLEDVLKKDVGVMSPRDVVVAHALVEYLVTARPTEAAEVFRRAGKLGGESGATAVEGGLNTKLPALEARLKRWLSETGAATAVPAKADDKDKKTPPGKG